MIFDLKALDKFMKKEIQEPLLEDLKKELGLRFAEIHLCIKYQFFKK